MFSCDHDSGTKLGAKQSTRFVSSQPRLPPHERSLVSDRTTPLGFSLVRGTSGRPFLWCSYKSRTGARHQPTVSLSDFFNTLLTYPTNFSSGSPGRDITNKRANNLAELVQGDFDEHFIDSIFSGIYEPDVGPIPEFEEMRMESIIDDTLLTLPSLSSYYKNRFGSVQVVDDLEGFWEHENMFDDSFFGRLIDVDYETSSGEKDDVGGCIPLMEKLDIRDSERPISFRLRL